VRKRARKAKKEEQKERRLEVKMELKREKLHAKMMKAEYHTVDMPQVMEMGASHVHQQKGIAGGQVAEVDLNFQEGFVELAAHDHAAQATRFADVHTNQGGKIYHVRG
jgi:hypothetical protein